MGYLDDFNTLRELAKEVSQAELKSQLLERILDAQARAMELQDENAALKRKIETSPEEVRKQVRFRDNAYWRDDDDPPQAYCTACLDT